MSKFYGSRLGPWRKKKLGMEKFDFKLRILTQSASIS